MLRLYRDCTNPPGGQVALQTTAPIDFYYGSNGAFYQRVTLNRVELVIVNPNLDSCVADPGICVQEGLFTAIVNNLPPIAGGYHMYFETCCRNNSIDNLNNPGNQGEGYYCKISDNTLLLTNSSPQWRNPPPVFVCLNQNMAFDHGATDADGDSLVYSFYTPFSDIDYVDFNNNLHQVTFTAGNPNNIPAVPFLASFSANNPLDVTGATNLTVNSNGIINGIPPNMGQYVAGIKCDEYRNGVKIGTVYRDFQFNVVVCPPPALAGIGPVNACNGTSITFDNTSTSNANDFTWNFGDGSPTSNAFEPSHTYASLGTYTVTLIAQTGTPCADTATRTFTLSFSNANFNSTASTCINTPVNFTNTSTASGGSTINSWNWNFGDGTPNSTLPNPSHTFATSGTLTVTLIVNSTAGCRDTIQLPVNVQGLPVADVGGDVNACLNNPQINLNGVVTNASGGQWLNYSGTMTPNDTDPNATYDPSSSEINAGSMDLIWETTGNGLCPSDVDTLHITFVPGPTVDAGPDIQVCRDTTSVPLQGTVTVAGGGIWSTTGNGTFSPVNSLNTTYTLDASDTALDSLYIYLTTTFNGNCIASTDSLLLEFYDPPQIVISNNDTSCAGHYIQLVVTSTTGSGIWSTNGTGNFAPDSTIGAQYLPSSADETNGSVVLYFTTTNNGGCRMVEDSIEITIIPSPTPSFTFIEDCFNETTVFTDGSTSVGSVVAWEWDFGDGTSNQQNPSHIFSTEGTQAVTLVVTSNNGCTDTLTQNVLVHYLPIAAFTSPNPCLNGGTDFEDQSTVTASSIVSWDWSFGDGGSDVVQDPTHQYAAAGSYSVTLIVESAFGCLDTVTNGTTVLPGPVASFTSNDNTVSLFEEVTFTDLSSPPSNISSWYWDFEDGSNSTDQNPIHSWDSAGYYNVMLVVEDDNGCVDTVTNEIIVFLPPFIPTGFTPNGDPNNSVLFVLGGPFKELQFDIYNNWGEIIFTSVEQSNGWDGTYKSAPQPMGVYVYTVKAITLDDVEHNLAGDVTLIR
jgi:gliding motility-associated-like protein